MSISSLLQQAVAHQQQGNYLQAQELYYQVLKMDARQFDALHLLGVARRQCGDLAGALDWIGQAIAVDPGQASAHCNFGVALADSGRLEDAVQSYDRAIVLNAGYAMAYANRGNALRRLGRLEEALASHDKALLIAPASADVLCNRALVLFDLGRLEDALASAERALESKPRHAEAHSARGTILQAMQSFEEAIDSYSRAIECHGTNGANQRACAQAHCNRGTALHRVHALDEALRDFDRAIALRPGYALAMSYRGNVLRSMGRLDDAALAYEAAGKHGADADKVQFALAALGKGDAPAAPPQGQVRALFDQYAGHFDQHLQGTLDYRIPALIGQALQSAGVVAGLVKGLTIELGCGTGLCAGQLRPVSSELIGVDLSEPMLAKARTLGLYDELIADDMVGFLSRRQAPCDLIVAADVFVYLGDLEPVFAAARARLSERGKFCFSVEAADEDADGAGKQSEKDFVLQASNRYAHSRRYLERLAHAHQFEFAAIEKQVVRRERQHDLFGYVVVLRA